MVAAAVIGGAVIAGGSTLIAGSDAASATKSATNAAIGEQNAILAQQTANAAPYTGLGQAAIPQYEALLGIGSGGPGSPGTLAALQNTPGYQFTQQQGETGILNAASASGGVSGNTLAALDKYNAGLADTTYQNAVGNAQNAVGIGQAAAAGQAANLGAAGSNISSALINQGNTTAGIDANLAASLSKIGANTGNQLIANQTLGALNSQTSPAMDQAALGSTAGMGGLVPSGGGNYMLNLPTSS